MNKKSIIYAALLLLSTNTWAKSTVHWGYEDDIGPQNWSQLHSEYELCGSGKNQSPINITKAVEAKHSQLEIDYNSQLVEIVNNGHTIQVNVEPGSTMSIDQKTFELKQFHFHNPSENQINGKSFPLEGHFVHTDKNGRLAVVAVMFEEGRTNSALTQLWANMPEKAGNHKNLNTGVTAKSLLPDNIDYYRFNGSLTTPPCTEGVRWYVLKQPITISDEQVAKFSRVLHHANNRPVQALNARVILK